MSTYGVKQSNESKKATESKIECPDCHSMILKTNLSAHKKTKRHQNAVNPQPSDDSVTAQQATKRLADSKKKTNSKTNSKKTYGVKQVSVREPSYSEEDELEQDDEQDDELDDQYPEDCVDELEHDDISFEDEVMAGLELLNNKLDQLLSLDVVTKVRQCMDEINKQSQASHQITTHLIDNVRTHIIQEVKACNAGQPQFNVKTG